MTSEPITPRTSPSARSSSAAGVMVDTPIARRPRRSSAVPRIGVAAASRRCC
jgi:hypothetical protein